MSTLKEILFTDLNTAIKKELVQEFLLRSFSCLIWGFNTSPGNIPRTPKTVKKDRSPVIFKSQKH